MATTTTTTSPTVTSVTTSWLKLHERLVCLTLVLLFGGFGVEKYCDLSAQRAAITASATAQIAAKDAQNSLALAQQSAQTTAQFQALAQALSQQNAALNTAMAQRTAAVKTQMTVDSTLQPTALSERWHTLLPTVQPTVGANGSLTVTNQEAHDTVAQLEQVPVLVQDLKDETTVATNLSTELTKQGAVVDACTAQVTGLKTQISADDIASKAEIASVKAQGRKNSIKWFKRGFGLGFIAGIFAGHAAGI